jgi:hypothetical protein
MRRRMARLHKHHELMRTLGIHGYAEPLPQSAPRYSLSIEESGALFLLPPTGGGTETDRGRGFAILAFDLALRDMEGFVQDLWVEQGRQSGTRCRTAGTASGPPGVPQRAAAVLGLLALPHLPQGAPWCAAHAGDPAAGHRDEGVRVRTISCACSSRRAGRSPRRFWASRARHGGGS